MSKDSKTTRGGVVSLLGRRHEGDFDIQAGSRRGLSTADKVSTYLRTPGHLLSIIRFFSKESLESVATATEIPVATLQAYEKGQKPPPLHHLVALSKHYKAELRVLLTAFGHVEKSASKTSMGLAAKFDGELTPEEKLDLKNLVKRFSIK
jgi:transcriptional regulator with XRE-family HTH domain